MKEWNLLIAVTFFPAKILGGFVVICTAIHTYECEQCQIEFRGGDHLRR